MTSNLDPFGQPLWRHPAHYAAAAVALAASIAMPGAWLELRGRPEVDSWWPLDAVLLAAATGYLLALAELHVRASTWRPNDLVPRLWLLGRALGANLTIAVFVIILLVRGSQSNVARAGLWILPPLILAAIVASAWTIVLAFRDGWRRFRSDLPPAEAPHGKPNSELVHGLLAVALLLAMYAIEQVEPKYAPPKGARAPAAATSPAADRTPPAGRPLSLPPPAAN